MAGARVDAEHAARSQAVRLLVEIDLGVEGLLAGDEAEAVIGRAQDIAGAIGDIVAVGPVRSIRSPDAGRAPNHDVFAARLLTAWSDVVGSFDTVPRRHLQAYEIAPDREPGAVASHLRDSPHVATVYADPRISVGTLCLGDPARGTSGDVRDLLRVTDLASREMDGHGARLAVVDVGVNLDRLRQTGLNPRLAQSGHHVPEGILDEPGAHPVGHGTMCAFDALLAAPSALLVDSAALRSTGPNLEAWLDEAVAAYDPLLAGMQDEGWASLVVSNSWAVKADSGDLPPGDPGNYGSNPDHVFNVQVRALEASGADIVFAAGNCGRACSPDCCGFGREPRIVGANSLGSVLTIGACDVSGVTSGYSSSGPGSIDPEKPDLVTYSHFAGSGVWPADNGTSAACPVAAGVIAAIRSVRPAVGLSPAKLRAMMRASAIPGSEFDPSVGYGRLDVARLLAKL